MGTPSSSLRSGASGDGVTLHAGPPENDILSKLPALEFAAIMEEAEEISLKLREELFEPRDTLERVYFPLNGMISLVTLLQDGTAIEAMTVGREGFVGLPLVNGVETARYRGMCQVAGNFVALDTKRFLDILETTPDLKRRLYRYSQFAHEAVAQSAACNGVHTIEARCARWLLLSSDAVGRSTFSITHEFLSQMLAVRRPGVTVAVGALERKSLISHQYGKISILDAEGLRKAA
jgi:CRP-like cAMP-binding protein